MEEDLHAYFLKLARAKASCSTAVRLLLFNCLIHCLSLII